MIKSLHILDPKDMPVAWWSDVAALESVKQVNFTPGINVLFGPNGVGKTTILKVLARSLFCAQGGRSVVTRTAINDLQQENKNCSYPRCIPVGARVEHDGQSVTYIDPHNYVGLLGGMAAFDADFISEARSSIERMRMSSGQSAISSWLISKGNETIEWRVSLHAHSSRHDEEQEAIIKKMLEPSIEKGPKTTLWDEPDANLDWPTKATFWNTMSRSPHQHIVTTHSPFALTLRRLNPPNFNFIDLKPGYADICDELLRGIVV